MLTLLAHQKNCKKNTLVTDHHSGETVCVNCGAVLSERSMDIGTETMGITGEEYQTNSRVGRRISLKMADMGLYTIMESKDKDLSGKILSKENQRMFYRLRIWDRNSKSVNSIKSLQKAFIFLDGISAKLSLPESVVEYTAYLFRKIEARKILAGRSTSDAICATAYIACRLTNTPRTLQDISQAGNVKKKNLQRIYRFITKELDIHPQTYDPLEFVTRIANAVNISEKTERLAFRILIVAAKNNISTSKNPMSMASAAIHLAYVINKEKASQIKISKVSGISAVTIRNRTEEIREKIGSEING